MLRLSRRGLIVMAVLGVSACKRPELGKLPPPATITGKRPESEIARVTLTAQAAHRLGIRVVPAVRRSSARTRTLGGDVVPSSGRSLVIGAPIAGRLANAGADLRVGQMVKRGDPLLRLTPVASVDRDLRANGERAEGMAAARLAAMEARLARAEGLLPSGAGSVRSVEEARAERDSAKAERDAAKSRMAMLDRAPLEADVAVILRAPEDGVVRAVSAAPPTLVPAGAPLVELVGTGTLWVKVNVFVGDLHAIRPAAAARVRPLTAPPLANDVEALPMSGPPTADPSTASFDLYFALPSDATFRPGERVAATLEYGGESAATSVPAQSLVRDVSGSAWVYEAVAERAFERRRVELVHIDRENAYLAHGIGEGTPVVAEGASELYGFEFGSGK